MLPNRWKPTSPSTCQSHCMLNHFFTMPRDHADLCLCSGADEVVPVYCFVVVQTDLRHWHSECNFIEAFMEESTNHSLSAYLFTQLLVAVNYLKTMHIKK